MYSVLTHLPPNAPHGHIYRAEHFHSPQSQMSVRNRRAWYAAIQNWTILDHTTHLFCPLSIDDTVARWISVDCSGWFFHPGLCNNVVEWVPVDHTRLRSGTNQTGLLARLCTQTALIGRPRFLENSPLNWSEFLAQGWYFWSICCIQILEIVCGTSRWHSCRLLRVHSSSPGCRYKCASTTAEGYDGREGCDTGTHHWEPAMGKKRSFKTGGMWYWNTSLRTCNGENEVI